MRYDAKRLNRLLFLYFTCIIAFLMLTAPPRRYGDGLEYSLMLQSWSHHLNPDLRPEDVAATGDLEFEGMRAADIKLEDMPRYFRSLGGRWYCSHFWAYSLLCTPIKILLDFLDVYWLRAFQLTNAVLYIGMLAAVNHLSKLTHKQKLFFSAMLILSPALWFIHWTHPEVMSYVFVTLALVFMDRGNYGIAVLSAGIASLQNQPLILLVLLLLIRGVWASRDRIRGSIRLAVPSLFALTPNVFYYLNYGQLTLTGDTISVDNLSAFRIWEMFFDLNIGMVSVIPIPLFMYLGVVAWRTYTHRRFTFEAQTLALLVLMMAICSTTGNWNHGTTGPSRYVIWMLPIIFYVLVRNLKALLVVKNIRYVLAAGLLTQLALIWVPGVIPSGENYTDHRFFARLALDNLPSLYNPSHDIFCERTLHREWDCIDPTIYFRGDKCRKALTTCAGIDGLKATCGSIPDWAYSRCAGNETGEWFYVDY